MKQLLPTLAVLAILAAGDLASPLRAAEPERIPVKIISYNIKDGFTSDNGELRKKQISAWLKAQHPDIVGLAELCEFKEASTLKDFAASYGHPYYAQLKESGYPVGITSKTPIDVVSRHTESPLWHGFIHARTKDLDIIVLHTSPFRYDTRLEETRHITEYMRKNDRGRWVLLGDYNAFAPADADLLETGPRPGVDSYRAGRYDYSAMSELLAFPLCDTVRRFVPGSNCRRLTFPAHRDSLEADGWRLDYILTSPALFRCAVNGWVWNNTTPDAVLKATVDGKEYVSKPRAKEGDTPEFFSDHYPVGIRLLLPAQSANAQ